ncbi:MAG TPA: hypothetical protein VNC50_17995, partial [Planctomycetia bacterium]|nr:hypothetical protein [Planctomycetia bacterium]
MTATTLEPALQALLEDRLDAVERVLLRNGAGRLERQAVLEEIESRAHELLDARAPENPTRSDLLAALAQLDPPEAYASERVVFAPPADLREELQGPRRRAVAAAPAAPPRPRVCPIAIL